MSSLTKTIIIVLCAIIIIISILSPYPESLDIKGRKCLGIFVVTIILWVTQVLPLSITSLLVIGLLPLLGILKADEAMASFGNKSVFFIIGAFIMASAMMKTGLSTRVAAYLLKIFGRGGAVILAYGIMLTSAFLAFWMPEHAVAALIFPIVLELSHALKLSQGKSVYGKVLFLSLAWGTIIGGVATFLGGARNPLALGMLNNRYNLSIGFFEWMIPVLPVVITLLIVAPFVMYFVLGRKKESVDIKYAGELLQKTLEKMGNISYIEIKTAFVVIVTIISWIIWGNEVGLAVIAILSGVSLFILNVLEWKDVQKYVNWGVIIMYGGAIVLGNAINKTHTAEWLANNLMSNIHLSKFSMIALISLISIILTEAISNAAVVAIMLPIAYSVGDAMMINPIVITYAVAIPAGLAFCLPIGTPPNAICYSAGYYKVWESAKAGVFMNLLSWLIYVLFIYFYWPLIGLNL